MHKSVCCNKKNWRLLMRPHCTRVVSPTNRPEPGQVKKNKNIEEVDTESWYKVKNNEKDAKRDKDRSQIQRDVDGEW